METYIRKSDGVEFERVEELLVDRAIIKPTGKRYGVYVGHGEVKKDGSLAADSGEPRLVSTHKVLFFTEPLAEEVRVVDSVVPLGDPILERIAKLDKARTNTPQPEREAESEFDLERYLAEHLEIEEFDREPARYAFRKGESIGFRKGHAAALENVLREAMKAWEEMGDTCHPSVENKELCEQQRDIGAELMINRLEEIIQRLKLSGGGEG